MSGISHLSDDHKNTAKDLERGQNPRHNFRHSSLEQNVRKNERAAQPRSTFQGL